MKTTTRLFGALSILMLFFLNRNAANGGIRNSATIIEAASAKVLVKAKGLNNFPSAPMDPSLFPD